MSANLVVPPPTQQQTANIYSAVNQQHFQQPIPFIPMVPPLTNSFAPPLASVTSGLVENLINNNPTPTTLSSQASTTVTTSVINPQQSSTVANEMNANSSLSTTSAIDNLATQTANELFISQHQTLKNPQESGSVSSVEKIVQTNVIQPPSTIPSVYQQPHPSISNNINQQFMQNEGDNH